LLGIEAFTHTVRRQTHPAHIHLFTLAYQSSNTVNMSGIPASPRFYQQPLRYLKWASINKPAYFYSIIVGCAGPVLVFTVPPIRRYLGEEPIPKIPLTYPSTTPYTHAQRRTTHGLVAA
jgi:hypothetical protein